MLIKRNQAAMFAHALLAAGTTILWCSHQAQASANGLALKPPMGWNSWNAFHCDNGNPNASTIRAIADAMVSSGLKAAGYQYINIDDCWQASNRDANGNIREDTTRFPNGMKALADYVHSKGLKLGIYTDRGTATCAGYPGSYAHEAQDAKTYASWGIDYVKEDNCNIPSGREGSAAMQTDYTTMANALRNSGRSIVFSICAWQFLDWMPSVGNLWRTTGDIANNFESVTSIMDVNSRLAPFAKPGAWNDPDMLEVGNGMSDDEDKAHFTMWAMMAAPLITGNDLRNMSQATTAILTNADAIAIDQDQLGAQGILVRDDGETEIWSKKLSASGTRAVALLNRSGYSATLQVSWSEIGLATNVVTGLRDVWRNLDISIGASNSYSTTVPAHGVALLKVSGQEGPPPSPNVIIANTDSRTITDLRVTAEFQVDGWPHYDYQDVGTFDKTIYLDVDGWGGTYDGSRFTGDLLYLQASLAGTKTLTIHKVDGRAVSNLRLSVNFNVNGAPHYDYEDIGDFAGSINLMLNGNGGSWDGSKYVGNFLHR